MNREQAKELLPIIQAFADGKEVQLKKTDGWVALKDPLWNLSPTNYRINQAREFWVNPNKMSVWSTGGTSNDCILVREVLEGE